MVRFGRTVTRGAAPTAVSDPERAAPSNQDKNRTNRTDEVTHRAAGKHPTVDRTMTNRITAADRISPRNRITIISASMGAGHDGAAAELARRISATGTAVDRYDLLDLLPAGFGKLLSDGYHRLLVHAPWVYQRIYSTTEDSGGCGPLARALLRATENRLLRALPSGTGAVVSTYPGASRILGALRLDGRLTIPVLTYLTDFSVHPLWVAPGVDVHLAAHAVPAAQARALGAADVRVCGPVTDPRFRPGTPGERGAARVRFGLPADVPLALLVAGSWGVGELRLAAAEIRDCGAAVPVVVCGRNGAMAEQLRADGIEHAFGWTDDMPGLMHAADVLVQNAGGLTSLEAFATGLPVASYRCIPGHGMTNAAALDEAGVATWIRTPDDLAPTLRDLVDGPLGVRQRAAAHALFADGPHAGPAGAILRTRHDVPGTAPADAVASAPAATAAPTAPRLTGASRRPTARKLAVTVAAACAVSLCAVGTGVATTRDSPALLRSIGHRLDPDDIAHTFTRQGPRP